MRWLTLAFLLSAMTTVQARAPGQSFRDKPFAPVMVVIPAGTAILGSAEAETTREGRAPAFAAFEHPQRDVTFAKSFAVGRYHVTQREFAVFVKATGRPMDGCVVAIGGKWSDGRQRGYSFRAPGWKQRSDEPAVCVDWDDATAYAAWLSQKTGATYRLLSEDEWEYAARGRTTSARWWGDIATTICMHVNGGDRRFSNIMPADKSANTACDDGFAYTSPVTRFGPNPFGLHDMLGNAWQWTANCFSARPATAAAASGACAGRSIRGGSWHNGVSTLRAATRFSLPPDMRSSSLGFRVMRELP